MKLSYLLPLALIAVGCSPTAEVANTSSDTSGSSPIGGSATTPEATNEASNSAPESNSSAPTPEAQGKPGADLIQPLFEKPKDGEEVAVISTTHGKIIFKFRPDLAPKHVENFKKLANKGFYDKTLFHRIIPDFMIQGGDPNTKDPNKMDTYGQGGPGYMVKAEFNRLNHKRGVISMARSQDPDSAGSQFFVCVGNPEFLNRQYTAFGEVVVGMDTADKIVAQSRGANDLPDQRIEMTVKIAKWPVK